jgi:hypothetical protein
MHRRLLYGAIVAIYVLLFPYHPGLRSPNELSRLMQARALVDFGEPSLNRAMRVYGPIGDLAYRDGHFYPSKAPLLSYAAAPIYALLRLLAGGRVGAVPEIPLVFFSRLLLTVAPTLLALVFLGRFLTTYVDETTSDLLVAFYAFGTLAFSYSLQFLSHQTSAVLLFLSFYAAWGWARGQTPTRVLVLAGFLAGMAVATEYTSAMAAGLLAVWVPFARPGSARSRILAVALVALGAGVPLALLGAYHEYCFGSPLETGYKHLADAAYQPWHLGGFLGIRTPDPRALILSLFSPLRGLFALSPGLLVGIAGLPLVWRARSQFRELGAIAVFTTALLVSYLYFTSSFSYESWGWTTGPRHMTGLVPFLLLPCASALQALKSPFAAGGARGLLGASVLVTGWLTLLNYVPDNVSEPLVGLVLPLARRGDLVPSVLNFIGLPNPGAGILFFLAFPALAALLLLTNTSPVDGRLKFVLAGTATIALVLGAHLVSYRNTPGDRGAVDLLSRVWLAPAGVVPRFWSTTGRP